MKKFQNLFSPGQIGSVLIKNRIVMPAMGTILCGPDGEMTDHAIAYYSERAAGGTGLIISEIISIEYGLGKALTSQLRLDDDRFISGFSRLTGSVQKYGTKFFAQLHHAGNQSNSSLTGGKQIVAPSPVINKAIGEVPRELTTTEVRDIINKFIQAAVRAKIAGFDGVELHGAHGYILNQFSSPHTNKRSDEFGGSFENRMRFTVDIIHGIKKECGKDFPVIARFSADEFIDNGINLSEGVKIGIALSNAGVDALDVSSGTYESMQVIIEPYMYKEGWRSYLAESVKKEVSIPVITVGAIKLPAKAEEILNQKKADFVAIGRGHLCDSQWAGKSASGNENLIIPCIGCMYCIDSIFSMKKIQCAVNARTGRELEFPAPKKDGEGRVVSVIGAGPAGMEAARVLKMRGFKPIVYEQKNEPGGELVPGCYPPDKEPIRWYKDALLKNLIALDIEIKTGFKAEPQQVMRDDNPYAIIVAIGAKPLIPGNIIGIDRENVLTAIDVLNNPVLIQKGSNVSIIGGGMTGCELAELILSRGSNATIIEMQSELATNENSITRTVMLQRLQQNSKIVILTNHKLVSVKDDSLEIEQTVTGEKKSVSSDYVVLSLGLSSLKKETAQWKEVHENVYVVGDAISPSKVAFAIRTAFDTAYVLN